MGDALTKEIKSWAAAADGGAMVAVCRERRVKEQKEKGSRRGKGMQEG